MRFKINSICLLTLILAGLVPLVVHSEKGASVTAEELLNKSRELQRLREEIEEAKSHYKKNTPKTIFLTGRQSQKPFYAEYQQAVREKIERTGEQNFPQAVLELQESFTVRASITIKYDGSLKEVRVVRPSGNKAIDDTVIKIAQLAAPFEPFPDEIKKEAEFLVILDEWMFMPNSN